MIDSVRCKAPRPACRTAGLALMLIVCETAGCRRSADELLQDHELVFATDYVDLKLDTMRMKHGEQVAARFEPKGGGGVPWMVILDASGNVLTSSIGQQGNIGYPYQPDEISHFLTMLRETRQSLSDADLAQIEADLNHYRTDREQEPATN